VSASAPEETPRREGFLDRFKRFPRRLRLYIFLQHLQRSARDRIERMIGSLKRSAPAAWVLRQVYIRYPERVNRALGVQVEGNHVIEAYAAHLEAMVKMSRDSGAKPVIVLQPRSAYREFLKFLPGDAPRANLKSVRLLRAGRAGEAISPLRAQCAARPRDAITWFNLAVAYRLAGQEANANHALDAIVSIRSFTMNAVADRTAARLDVPVVYTPLAFEESDDPSLFFPDRYHTRPAGYALVAGEVKKVLVERGLLGNAPVPDS
jgi:hypothetical protein